MVYFSIIMVVYFSITIYKHTAEEAFNNVRNAIVKIAN